MKLKLFVIDCTSHMSGHGSSIFRLWTGQWRGLTDCGSLGQLRKVICCLFVCLLVCFIRSSVWVSFLLCLSHQGGINSPSLKMTAEQLHVNQGISLPWRFKEKYGQQTTLVWRLSYVAVFTEGWLCQAKHILCTISLNILNKPLAVYFYYLHFTEGETETWGC